VRIRSSKAVLKESNHKSRYTLTLDKQVNGIEGPRIFTIFMTPLDDAGIHVDCPLPGIDHTGIPMADGLGIESKAGI